jgi:hypothetical protein
VWGFIFYTIILANFLKPVKNKMEHPAWTLHPLFLAGGYPPSFRVRDALALGFEQSPVGVGYRLG